MCWTSSGNTSTWARAFAPPSRCASWRPEREGFTVDFGVRRFSPLWIAFLDTVRGREKEEIQSDEDRRAPNDCSPLPPRHADKLERFAIACASRRPPLRGP